MKYLLPLFLFPALAFARPLTVHCEVQAWRTVNPQEISRSQLYYWAGEGYFNSLRLSDDRGNKAELAVGVSYDKENNYHFYVEREFPRADAAPRVVRLASTTIPAPIRGLEFIVRAQGDFVSEPEAQEADFKVEMKCKYGNS